MHRESRRRIAHKQLVEIERVVEIILGRRRKPAFRVGPGERHRHADAGPHIEKAVDIAGPERALGETPGKGGDRQGRRMTAVGAPLGRPPMPLRLRSIACRAVYFVAMSFCNRNSPRLEGEPAPTLRFISPISSLSTARP